MPKLFFKTKIIFLMQLLLYLTVPFAYWGMFKMAFYINTEYLSWAPFNILLPGAIIISMGIASFYSIIIVRGIAWYFNQALVVAATVLVNGLPYKGSLTAYSFGEVNKCLLIFSTKSVISRKTFRWLNTIKNSLLNKEILQGLFNHKWAAVRIAFGLIRKSMSNTLDFADEILVSYTWMMMRLYKDYGPDGKKPKFTKMVKNQAKFFLEGFIHFIRCYPKLVVSTLFPVIGINIIVGVVSILLVAAAIFIFGINWVNILWMLFFWTAITGWVERVFVQYSHTLIMLDKFYAALHKMESISIDSLVQIIGSIPVLANIAKKTGMKEFKDMKFEETCPPTLLEVNSVEEMLGDEARKVCDLFDIDSDELPVADDDITDEAAEEGAEPNEENTDEEKPEEVEQSGEIIKANQENIKKVTENNHENTKPDAENLDTETVIITGEEADDDEFSFEGVSAFGGKFVKKFESSKGGGSNE